jgi:CTP synthase (UTP-ammonia lyase)
MMRAEVHIGLIGDHDPAIVAHRAIPVALQLAAEGLGVKVLFDWLDTDGIVTAKKLAGYHGLWCVPGSPYRSMAGALLAIRHARTQRVPFLGSCGGFQHAVIEYARDVLQWPDADHAETAPDSACAVISLLQCPLVEKTRQVDFAPGSRIARTYGTDRAKEGYHCSYGLNPSFADALTAGPLRVSARDAAAEVRAVELDDHPFFIATLFQSERRALRGETPALARALLRACMGEPA